MVAAAFWLAAVIWAYRDMRARSRDPLAQILVAVMVTILNIPGAFIYILLRPRETLSEAYERSLEEEALLQEIEEKPSCPGCGQRTQENWQVCPHCHTKLKKPCIHCGHMLELAWNICPHCATPQARYRDDELVVSGYNYTNTGDSIHAITPNNTAVNPTPASDSLEFIEGDDY
jgi:hypothetical protein